MKCHVLLLIVIALLSAGTAQAEPLDDLIARKAGATACFTRAYDDAHLRKNPKQKITFIAAWMRYAKVPESTQLQLEFSFALRRRGEADALFSSGSCVWDKMANRDTSNNRLISAFKKDEGAVCVQSARPDVFEATAPKKAAP